MAAVQNSCENNLADARKAAANSVSPASILGFQLTKETTVSSLISAQEGYKRALEDIGSTANFIRGLSDLCAHIPLLLYTNRLTNFDGRLALWAAVMSNSTVAKKMITLLGGSDDAGAGARAVCLEHLKIEGDSLAVVTD